MPSRPSQYVKPITGREKRPKCARQGCQRHRRVLSPCCSAECALIVRKAKHRAARASTAPVESESPDSDAFYCGGRQHLKREPLSERGFICIKGHYLACKPWTGSPVLHERHSSEVAS